MRRIGPVDLEPPGVHTLLLTHHVPVKVVRRETRAAATGGKEAVAGAQTEALIVETADLDTGDHREAVSPDPAKQRMRQPADLGGDLAGVDTRFDALLRRRLRRRRIRGQSVAEDSWRSGSAVVDEDAVHLHGDGQSLPVVDVHKAP
jgi:hypothetical protein